jgi:hypothetical protein
VASIARRMNAAEQKGPFLEVKNARAETVEFVGRV